MADDLEDGVKTRAFHVERIEPGPAAFHVKHPRSGAVLAFVHVLGLGLVAVLAAGCEGSRGSFVRGERETSASVRGSRARPTPGDDASHPLGRDRFALDEAVERRRAQHQQEHAEGSLRIEGFSHPACAGVEPARKRRCPLIARRFGRARPVEGGVELELAERVDAVELRRELLCHMAYGRTTTETRCPLHVEGLEVRSEHRGDRLVLGLRTTGKAVEELRARLKAVLR